MKNSKNLLLFGLLASSQFTCSADTLKGVWDLYKTLDYQNLTTSPTRVETATLRASDDRIEISPNCTIKLHKEDYRTDVIFQPLLKSGQKKQDIDRFFQDHLNFQPNRTMTYYQASSSGSCNRLGSDIILAQDKLILINGGIIFNIFIKSTPKEYFKANSRQAEIPKNIKVTPLPFNTAQYMEHCIDHYPKKNSIPQLTHKCAPQFFPHVATSESKDFLSKTIGAHKYFTLGARNGTDDYDNPVSNGLHPVFLVFPPLDDVILVRVDDIERVDIRDAISNVYLAIKNNQVIDQLNAGCDFNTNYVCGTSAYSPRYQLTRRGKFIKLE